MKYDFETIPDRSAVGSEKWKSMKIKNPNLPKGIVPFSVADMEFMPQPELVAGLTEYLKQPIYGYTGPTDSYFEAVINWMERHHGFRPKKEWLIQTPGIVPALIQLVAKLTKPKEAILIMEPVYYPFRISGEANERSVISSDLIRNGKKYEIDFKDLEEKASLPQTRLCILCSPHNPIGRVWTRDELLKLSEICLRNHVILIADEIHFDLILPGKQHVSIGTFEEKYLMNTILCTSPSKTFNLAGFQTSNLMIANPEYRKAMKPSLGEYEMLHTLGYRACEIVYNQCEDWLGELLQVIDRNRQVVEAFMAQYFPQITVFSLEGTYLLWMDFNGLGMEYQELERFMQMEAYWFLDEGYVFGKIARGYERMNLACPTKVIEDALKRLYKAWQKHVKKI